MSYRPLGEIQTCYVGNRVGKACHLRLEHLPLNHAQFAILQNLFIKDGQSQSDIARRVGKDRAAISRSLNTLEENGLIIRKAVSGSKNGIFLTEKAMENRKKIADAINMAIRKGRQGMTVEEYENGISFLQKIYGNLK